MDPARRGLPLSRGSRRARAVRRVAARRRRAARAADLYERLAELGFEYGPAFQGLGAAWRRARSSTPRSRCPRSRRRGRALRHAPGAASTPPSTPRLRRPRAEEGSRGPTCPSPGAGSALGAGAAAAGAALAAGERRRLLADDPSGAPALESTPSTGARSTAPAGRARREPGSLFASSWQELPLPEAARSPATLLDPRVGPRGAGEASHAVAAEPWRQSRPTWPTRRRRARLAFLTQAPSPPREGEPRPRRRRALGPGPLRPGRAPRPLRPDRQRRQPRPRTRRSPPPWPLRRASPSSPCARARLLAPAPGRGRASPRTGRPPASTPSAPS